MLSANWPTHGRETDESSRERGLESKRGQKRGILTSTRLEIIRVVEDGRKAKKASGKKNVHVRVRERERNESGSLINCSFYKVAETCQQCQ